MKVGFAFVSFMKILKLNSSLGVLQFDKYTKAEYIYISKIDMCKKSDYPKIIKNYIKTLKSNKFNIGCFCILFVL